jgi:CheY-like chemotaxis protein
MKHILLVDDDKISLKYLQIIMKKYKYTCDSAVNGKEAYELFLKNNYDCILMDIKMPIMNGVECSKLIRQYENNNNINPTKIIAVTAMAYDNELLKNNFDNYIVKPFKFENLMKLL